MTEEQALCALVNVGHCWKVNIFAGQCGLDNLNNNTSLRAQPVHECRHCGYKEREVTTRAWVEIMSTPKGTSSV